MYAVIDTETTGLSPVRDRIIELAIIGLDAQGNLEWEWCTLLNPDRNTGHGLTIRVHQIYSSDVHEAPRFSECAGHIADLLRRRILIGHNLRFDVGMLLAEFARLGYRIPDPPGICTLELAHTHGLYPADLCSCCDVFDIAMDGAHHALADARATAALGRHLLDFDSDPRWLAESTRLDERLWPTIPVQAYTPISRPILPGRAMAPRHTLSSRADRAEADTCRVSEPPDIEHVSTDPHDPALHYLAALETAISDRVISDEQASALKSLAEEFGLSDEQVAELHLLFLRGLAGSMWADGRISAHERYDLAVTARALRLEESHVESALACPAHPPEPGQSAKADTLFTG